MSLDLSTLTLALYTIEVNGYEAWHNSLLYVLICSLFWPWPCMRHNRSLFVNYLRIAPSGEVIKIFYCIVLVPEELTNRNMTVT